MFLRRFSYKDIKRATGSFGRIIAVRSHGSVYNAKFKDGHVALVKEIKAFNQAKDVFYREVQHLGRLHHRHLVALRGFSAERERFYSLICFFFSFFFFLFYFCDCFVIEMLYL